MIFLSIINHGHDKMIVENKHLECLAEHYPITIKSNTPASEELINFTSKNNITLLNEAYNLGFGDNNNYVFNYLTKNEKIINTDHFLVINPDVILTLKSIKQLTKSIEDYKSDIYTINLYQDQDLSSPDPSIKKFPKLLNPLLSLLKIKRLDIYDKNLIMKPTIIDWAAGSFLLFKKTSYEKLNGFDKKYFMYFEDVDICYRAKKENMLLTYIPKIKAVHKGAYNNRNIFTIHFWWYLKSYFLYHSCKLTNKKSQRFHNI